MADALSNAPAAQLVPTQFRQLNGRVFNTHQFSVTEFFTVAKARGHGGIARSPPYTLTRMRPQPNEGVLPAVFFTYDFSPVTLTIEEQRRPLLHFLTRICAVVGGVVALFGMFSKLV